MATRDDRTETYNPVWIDGSRAEKDPIQIQWDRPSRGTAGTGAPLFSSFRSCRLSLGVLTESEFSWWHSRWDNVAKTVQMPHPDASITNPNYPALDYVYEFTGVYYSDLDWRRSDEFYYNVVATFTHIQV